MRRKHWKAWGSEKPGEEERARTVPRQKPEARRAETCEDRPAVTHNASFNLPVKVKIRQFSVSSSANMQKHRLKENEAGQTPGRE